MKSRLCFSLTGAGLLALVTGTTAGAQQRDREYRDDYSTDDSQNYSRSDNERSGSSNQRFSESRANREGTPRQSDRQQRSDHDRQESSERQSGDQGRAFRSASQMIERFDKNGDGALQRGELPENLRTSFARLDRNSDKKLSSTEIRQHARRMARRVIPLEVVYIWVSDADQGQLSLNELQDAYQTLQSIDRDGNGKLSSQELRQRREQNADRWTQTVMKRIDDNDNGQISLQEARDTFLANRFDRVDKNRDDRISRNELRQCLMARSGSQSQQDQDRQQDQDSQSRSETSQARRDGSQREPDGQQR
jgi:Ca2+-binding EF-hand superfamily protein